MAEDEKPVTKAELSEALNQVSAWIHITEKNLLTEIKKLRDEVTALGGQISHLD